ncbi:MAG: hypothetical protein HY788_16925 [Deltaproteobacteria bacterium]|nr:hypothetical protein [Deltaproteobacteria bacterium]
MFIVAIHQAFLTLLSMRERQNEVPVANDAASLVIDAARALGVAASFSLPKNIGDTVANISLNPLIDLGKVALQVASDIEENAQARDQFNRTILKEMVNDKRMQNYNWMCPRSKRNVQISIEQNSLRVSCEHLLLRPPLGCKVTLKKLAFAQLAFPPLIFLTLMKAFVDFVRVGWGASPFKTYGYCCLADKVVRGVLV